MNKKLLYLNLIKSVRLREKQSVKSLLLTCSTNSLKILPKLHAGPLHPDGHEAVVVVEIEVVVVVVVVVVVLVVDVDVVVDADLVDSLQDSPVQPSKQRQRFG